MNNSLWPGVDFVGYTPGSDDYYGAMGDGITQLYVPLDADAPLGPGRQEVRIPLRRYEVWHFEFEFHLFCQGEPWVPTGEYTVSMFFLKPDGTKVHYDLLEDNTPAYRVNGNVVNFTIVKHAATYPGKVLCYLNFSNSAKKQSLTFGPFGMHVIDRNFISAFKEPMPESLDYMNLSDMYYTSDASDWPTDIYEIHPVYSLCNTGSVIAVQNAMEKPIRNLSVYGRTILNGVPSPGSPAVFVDSQAADLYISRSNLLNPSLISQGTLSDLTVSDDGYVITLKGFEAHAASAPIDLLPFAGRSILVSVDSVIWESNGNAAEFAKIIITTADGTTQYDFSVSDSYEAIEVPAEAVSAELFLLANASDTALEVEAECSIRGLSITDPAFDCCTWEAYEQPQVLSLPTAGLKAVPVVYGGDYTDVDGQKWISDDIKLEDGVLIQKIVDYELTDDHEITITHLNDEPDAAPGWYDPEKSYSYQIMLSDVCGGLGLCSHFESYTSVDFHGKGIETGIMNDQNYIVVNISKSLGICTTPEEFRQWWKDNDVILRKPLHTPIEIPLAAETVEAFKALHTNNPYTYIYNSEGLQQSVSYQLRNPLS